MLGQTKLFTGRQNRDRGMKKAEDHAGKEWNEMADRLLDSFITNSWFIIMKRQFMTEDFRQYASQWGLPQPPSLRAFGSVILRAARAGKIVKVGYGQVSNAKAHSANAAVWRKA